jgi:hypothetical protein
LRANNVFIAACKTGKINQLGESEWSKSKNNGTTAAPDFGEVLHIIERAREIAFHAVNRELIEMCRKGERRSVLQAPDAGLPAFGSQDKLP